MSAVETTQRRINEMRAEAAKRANPTLPPLPNIGRTQPTLPRPVDRASVTNTAEAPSLPPHIRRRVVVGFGAIGLALATGYLIHAGGQNPDVAASDALAQSAPAAENIVQPSPHPHAPDMAAASINENASESSSLSMETDNSQLPALDVLSKETRAKYDKWLKMIPPTVAYWMPLFLDEAQKGITYYNIDTKYLPAEDFAVYLSILATMESGGDPVAGSGAGARGLLQIMELNAWNFSVRRGTCNGSELKWNLANYAVARASLDLCGVDIEDPRTNTRFAVDVFYESWLTLLPRAHERALSNESMKNDPNHFREELFFATANAYNGSVKEGIAYMAGAGPSNGETTTYMFGGISLLRDPENANELYYSGPLIQKAEKYFASHGINPVASKFPG